MDEPDPTEDAARGMEAQRVFASVANSLLGERVAAPKIDRFELRQRLGSGAMGEVYSAYDPRHEREVALKVIAADLRAEPRAMARLRKEARVLAAIEHPHVVRVYEVGQADSGVFVAMERLHGETLADYLEREGTVPVGQWCAWLGAVADAIATAHDKGIVHRDLKPANLWLARDPTDDPSDVPRVTVLDFGIAKAAVASTLQASTASGAVLGTPHYMSPEQARDSTTIDHRCDLWALAIITFECLMGRRPFEGEGLAELAVALLTRSPPRPSSVGAAPPGFDEWFSVATAASIDERFDGARTLAASLAAAVEGRAWTRPNPEITEVEATGRRWPWKVAIAATAALGATAALTRGSAGVSASAPAEPARAAQALDRPEPQPPPVSPSTGEVAAADASTDTDTDTDTGSTSSTTEPQPDGDPIAVPSDSRRGAAAAPSRRPTRDDKAAEPVDDLEF